MRSMMWMSGWVVLSMIVLFLPRETRVEAGSDPTYPQWLTTEGQPCADPSEPNEASPADGARDVPVDTPLSWKVPPQEGCDHFRILASTGGLDLNVNAFSLIELMTDPVKEVHISSIGFLPSLDFSPTGILYGMSLSNLKIISPGAGVRSVCGPVHTLAGEILFVNGIAFHPDGTLYAVADDFDEIVFYTIDTGTGIATEKCRIPSTDGFVWGIDFSPDGVLYGAFSNLLSIDLIACRATRVGPRFSLPWVTDIDWAVDGFIYGVDEEERMLYKIDPSTGFMVQQYGPYDSELWGVASQCLDGLLTAASAQTTTPNMIGEGLIGESHAAQLADELLLAARRQLAIEVDRTFILELLASQGVPDIVEDEQARFAPDNAEEVSLRAAAQQGGADLTCDVYLDTVNPPVKLACQNVLPPAAGDVWTCDPGVLRPDMTYYWQVVAKSACGTTKASRVWSFKTRGPIFKDTFPSATIDAEKWAVVTEASVDEVGLDEPSAPYSLRLNGHPLGGDSIESRTIDLSGYPKVTLSYCYEQGGGGESPDPEDDLIIEGYNGVAWVELSCQLGSAPEMTSYECITVELPAPLLQSSFRLRIRNFGTSDTESVYDDWFVDDVILYAN